jgi:hypothetical protein
MPVRLWLHEGHDGEPGVEAWGSTNAEVHYYARNIGHQPERPPEWPRPRRGVRPMTPVIRESVARP